MCPEEKLWQLSMCRLSLRSILGHLNGSSIPFCELSPSEYMPTELSKDRVQERRAKSCKGESLCRGFLFRLEIDTEQKQNNER